MTFTVLCLLVHDSRHTVTTAVIASAPQLSRGDGAKVHQPSTTREGLFKPLTRLLTVLMGSTTQAFFH